MLFMKVFSFKTFIICLICQMASQEKRLIVYLGTRAVHYIRFDSHSPAMCERTNPARASIHGYPVPVPVLFHLATGVSM